MRAGKLAVIKQQRLRVARLPGGVESPVAGDDVEPTIAVKIPGGDAVPPADKSVEAEIRCDFTELAGLILKHPQWPPLTGQDQLRKPVAVQITEHRATDQADILQHLAVRRVQHEPSSLIAIQRR